MATHLIDRFEEIFGRLAQAPRVLLAFDYDGTLTPIVDDHRQAWLSGATRNLLSQLVARSNTTVAVISGRRLDDVRDNVKVPGIVYTGNHGLDISGPGLRFVEPSATLRIDEMRELAESLRQNLETIAGVEVENKDLTLSVHFRRVVPDDEDNVRQIVESMMPSADISMRMTPGHKVFEIRPHVAWNKGHAVNLIREHFGCSAGDVLYAGDDKTDEDAFAALPSGVTIKVGEASGTAAKYYVKSPAEVHQLLTRLGNLPQNEGGA